ncbi:MAG: baseplate J/gp47 family protein [Proteobacteria bacterium]|nr:baseplate J/gp47 family protein [Pseudomonadota bacterium]
MPIQFDENGLKTQSLSEILNERKELYKASFSDSFNLKDTSPAGKTIAINSEREALIQEAIQGVYLSNYRLTAKGVSLDYNLEITGDTREEPTKGTAEVNLRGDPSLVISAGSLVVNVAGTPNSFISKEETTLGPNGWRNVTGFLFDGVTTVTANTATAHTWSNGDTVVISEAVQPGFDGTYLIFNVTPTAFDYTVPPGSGLPPFGDAAFASDENLVSLIAEDAGNIAAPAGSLTDVISPTVGVESSNNQDDADAGSDIETDAEARKRTTESLNIGGGGYREAIIAILLDTAGVTSATLFENNDGLIPTPSGGGIGTVECFVVGGTDNDVATSVLNSVSAGVQSFGNITVPLIDSQNQPVSVSFSRLSSVKIYVEVTRTINNDEAQGPVYPITGDDDIKTALAAIEFNPGQDVWETTLREAITSSVPGIVTLSIKFDTITPPVNTSPIAINQISAADIDSSDVTIA